MSKREIENYLRGAAGFPLLEKPDVTLESVVVTQKDGTLHFSIPSHNMRPEQVKSFLASEKWIELTFGAMLRLHGFNPRHQVQCSAGIADIVSDLGVYEVKKYLTRQTMFEALGQALAYRQAINPDICAVIVGIVTPEAKALIPAIEAVSQGVFVVNWGRSFLKDKAQ